MSHGGYECICNGGSSGLTEINYNLLNFMKESHKNLPRSFGCVKVLQTPKKRICIYVSKKSTNVDKFLAVWKYSQPQQGGSFKISNELIKKYPVLELFSRCKINSA